MNAMNPDPEDRQDDRRNCCIPGGWITAPLLPELKRRLDLVEAFPRRAGHVPASSLSGGMKQRMVMVLSTLLNPSLLIADEITSALDVASQKAVAEMLVEFRNQGCCKSAIVITHDISILYQIADSILIMYAGQLGGEGLHRDDHPCRPGTRTRSC